MAFTFRSVIADIIFSLAVIFFVLCVYITIRYRHWKKRGIHYIEPTLFVGNLGNVLLQKKNVVELFRTVYTEAVGHKVVGLFIFHKPILMIRDLDVVRSVLAKDSHAFLNRFFIAPEKFDILIYKSLFATNGKKWRHLRIKLTPTFTSGKMKKMLHVVNACSNQLVSYMDQKVSEGRSIVVKDAMSRYTMNAIASCAFGVNTNALDGPNCEFITTMKNMLEASGIQMILYTLMICIPWLKYFVSGKVFDTGANELVRKTFWDVVDYRKKNDVVRKDFVDLLMQLHEQGEVRAEDTKDLEEIKQDSKYVNLEYSKTEDIKLDDDDIVAQAFIFILAGFETSSSVMRFTLFELALNPAIQDKLRTEIENVLEKYNSQVTYDAIAEMDYLDMVVTESMRKYPPVILLERECISDCKIKGTNITIEKGTGIFIPVHAIHYDPDFYPDPEKFDPERFSAENKTSRPNFAYLPFGEGPRKCIGTRFGLMQVKTGLVHILKTFQVRPCKDTPKTPLEMKPVIDMLMPKKEIILAFTKLK